MNNAVMNEVVQYAQVRNIAGPIFMFIAICIGLTIGIIMANNVNKKIKINNKIFKLLISIIIIVLTVLICLALHYEFVRPHPIYII